METFAVSASAAGVSVRRLGARFKGRRNTTETTKEAESDQQHISTTTTTIKAGNHLTYAVHQLSSSSLLLDLLRGCASLPFPSPSLCLS